MAKCPVCDKVGNQTCTGCKEVVYCSKQHQVEHWKLHKVQCRPFEVKQNTELGRHLIASRDIEAGTQLISEIPLVIGPKAPADPICLGCYQPLDIEVCARCPSCVWPACDVNCPGLTAQDHHLPECIVLSINTLPARMDKLNYDAILPLRCLLLQKKSPRKWKQLLSMESHFKDRDKNTEIYKEVEEKIVKYLKDNYLSHMDSGVIQSSSSEIIHFICGIIEVNGLEITTGDGDIMALYPNACLMEHNCLPNVKYKFNLEDFKISVKSAIDIKKGDHLSTMYTHTLWGTAARRDHLLRTKYFLCECKRCSDPTELGTHFSTLKCISTSPTDVTEKCSGIVVPKTGDENSDWCCNKCPLVLSATHVSDLVSRLGAQVDAAMEDPSVSKIEKLLDNLTKLLHTNHYHCFTVAHSLIQLWGREIGCHYNQMSNSLLKCKLDVCRRLENIIEVLDPEGARTALYTGVCFLEESLTLEELSKRTNEPLEKEKYLTEAKDALEKAKQGLDDMGPAASLRVVIRSIYIRILDGLKKYKIVEIS